MGAMNEPSDSVDILVVDDRKDNLLALQSLLDEPGRRLVMVTSGRDALRYILRQEFAVILLDVNMPGLDGFETAELIRRHRSSRSTPIIFLTAFGEVTQLEKGYSLGAVDYIQTPVVPEILTAKISVFVDLFRKNNEIKRQAESLRRRAAQLHKLTHASIAINSALSLDAILRAITDAARDILNTHQAMSLMGGGQERSEGRSVASFSDKYASFRDYRPPASTFDLYGRLGGKNPVLRMTARELEASVPSLSRPSEGGQGPALDGVLAAPLTESDGRSLGLILVSEKVGGEFTADDEAILVQLAQLGSIALQNCLHAEAREANRLKDEFLATLSHELRTPLNAILGWTRLLRTSPPDPVKLNRGLEVIERNVNAQVRLIEELLDVSRILTGKLRLNRRSLELPAVIEAAVDMLRPAADSKSISITTSAEGSPLEINGDPDRLQQVVCNLLTNAVKFTPKGGRIEVQVQSSPAGADLRVIDSGAGISAEFMPFVFDRFRQADSTARRSQGGLGIGLSVVRDIVELHGGSVSVSSEGIGRGSTFTIHFPPGGAGPHDAAYPGQNGVHEASPDSSPSSSLEGGRAPGRRASSLLQGLHVLLVDDDTDARDVLQEVLVHHDAQVTAVSSVSAALDAFETSRPHVLVSDIAMPGEDGFELIRQIRSRSPEEGGDLPAMALTAYARQEDVVKALAAGFQRHASKPIEPDDLVSAVASLAGRVHHHEEPRLSEAEAE